MEELVGRDRNRRKGNISPKRKEILKSNYVFRNNGIRKVQTKRNRNVQIENRWKKNRKVQIEIGKSRSAYI